MAENIILSLFSYLFIIWFIFVVVLQIYYSVRGRKEKAKKLLYGSFGFSILASLFLTTYTAVSVQNNFLITYMAVSFIGNFILWVAPVVIAFIVYFIYFRIKRYEFKEVTKEDLKEERMANKLKKHNEEYETKK